MGISFLEFLKFLRNVKILGKYLELGWAYRVIEILFGFCLQHKKPRSLSAQKHSIIFVPSCVSVHFCAQGIASISIPNSNNPLPG